MSMQGGRWSNSQNLVNVVGERPQTGNHTAISIKKEENKNSYRLEIRRQVSFPLVKLHDWHTLCSPDNFAPLNTLYPNLLCFSTHLHLITLWLLSTLYFQEHFAPHHTLLPGTLCFKRSREQTMLRRKMYQWAKCSWKQHVLGSKAFWWAKCSQGAKYESAVARSNLNKSLRAYLFQMTDSQ